MILTILNVQSVVLDKGFHFIDQSYIGESCPDQMDPGKFETNGIICNMFLKIFFRTFR